MNPFRSLGPRCGLAASVLVLTLGCLDKPLAPTFEVIEEADFDVSLGIDLGQMTRLESGVYIQDLVDGDGPEIAAGDSVDMEYTGWLRTGVEFGSGSFGYVYGDDTILPRPITGIELGMAGQQVGDERLIVIPPALAYGEMGTTGVPPGAIVVFDVKLISLS